MPAMQESEHFRLKNIFCAASQGVAFPLQLLPVVIEACLTEVQADVTMSNADDNCQFHVYFQVIAFTESDSIFFALDSCVVCVAAQEAGRLAMRLFRGSD